MIKLGEALKNESEETLLKTLKEEIQKIYTEQNEISMQKIVYLDSSIETQVNIFIYTYLGYLVTEKLVKEEHKPDSWIQAWDTYEALMNCSDGLVNTLTFYVSFIAKSDNMD